MKLTLRTCATFVLITVFPLKELLQTLRICLDLAEQVWNVMRFLETFPQLAILSSTKRGHILRKFRKDLGHVVLELCIPVCDNPVAIGAQIKVPVVKPFAAHMRSFIADRKYARQTANLHNLSWQQQKHRDPPHCCRPGSCDWTSPVNFRFPGICPYKRLRSGNTWYVFTVRIHTCASLCRSMPNTLLVSFADTCKQVLCLPLGALWCVRLHGKQKGSQSRLNPKSSEWHILHFEVVKAKKDPKPMKSQYYV